MSINAVVSGLMDDIPVESVQKFEKEYHDFIQRSYSTIIKELSAGSKPTEDLLKQIKKATLEFKKSFTA